MGIIRTKIIQLFCDVIFKRVKSKLEGKFMENKKWYQSKGIWAGLVTILIAVYGTIQPLVLSNFGFTLPNIPEWIYILLGYFGFYSRKTADTKIG